MDIIPKKTSVNARSVLLPYALGLIAAMLVVQVVIALTGGEITILAGILTAIVALGIAVWLWRSRVALNRIRFGYAIAHTLAFVAVTTSFNLHALALVITAGFDDAPQIAIGAPLLGGSWFGATIIMSGLWGLGLLIHLVGSVLGRGWED